MAKRKSRSQVPETLEEMRMRILAAKPQRRSANLGELIQELCDQVDAAIQLLESDDRAMVQDYTRSNTLRCVKRFGRQVVELLEGRGEATDGLIRFLVGFSAPTFTGTKLRVAVWPRIKESLRRVERDGREPPTPSGGTGRAAAEPDETDLNDTEREILKILRERAPDAMYGKNIADKIGKKESYVRRLLKPAKPLCRIYGVRNRRGRGYFAGERER